MLTILHSSLILSKKHQHSSLVTKKLEIGLYVDATKTEYITFNQNQECTIDTRSGHNLKAVDTFTYLGSNIASTEKDVSIRLAKAWSALNDMDIIWKSSLPDTLKRNFFRATVESILLYGSTTWTLTKYLEARLDGAYTRMLQAILNISWKQHPTKKQLYGTLSPITESIREARLSYSGHCWRAKEELVSDVLLWRPKHGHTKVGRPARTYIDQLRDELGCHVEDFPTMMGSRIKWRVRTKIRACSTR